MSVEPAPATNPIRVRTLRRPVRNADIAELFYRTAELLELEGANPFRAGAYRRAAGAIERLPCKVTTLISQHQDLAALPHIGEVMADQVGEICRTGRLQALIDAEARTPPELARLSSIPGLGPKRLQSLRDHLAVASVAALREALLGGRIPTLPGFGHGLEKSLKQALNVADDGSPPGQT